MEMKLTDGEIQILRIVEEQGKVTMEDALRFYIKRSAYEHLQRLSSLGFIKYDNEKQVWVKVHEIPKNIGLN